MTIKEIATSGGSVRISSRLHSFTRRTPAETRSQSGIFRADDARMVKYP